MAEQIGERVGSAVTGKWADSDIRDVLSESAKNIGAGSPTDAGRRWRLPTERPDPIVLAGGITDMPTVPLADFQKHLLEALAEETEDAMDYGGWLGVGGLGGAGATRRGAGKRPRMGHENKARKWGAMRAEAINPTRNGESVRVRTNHARARDSICIPVPDTAMEDHSRPKLRWRNMARG